jgi:hypothetical protein
MLGRALVYEGRFMFLHCKTFAATLSLTRPHPWTRLAQAVQPLSYRLSSTFAMPVDKVDTSSRLSKLRGIMRERDVHVYGMYALHHSLPLHLSSFRIRIHIRPDC